MNPFQEIPAEHILAESRSIREAYYDIPYIIYFDPTQPRWKIRINAKYSKSGGKVRVCVHYDRALCASLEDFKSLSREYIESEAYGAWMDGAR